MQYSETISVISIIFFLYLRGSLKGLQEEEMKIGIQKRYLQALVLPFLLFLVLVMRKLWECLQTF